MTLSHVYFVYLVTQFGTKESIQTHIGLGMKEQGRPSGRGSRKDSGNEGADGAAARAAGVSSDTGKESSRCPDRPSHGTRAGSFVGNHGLWQKLAQGPAAS